MNSNRTISIIVWFSVSAIIAFFMVTAGCDMTGKDPKTGDTPSDCIIKHMFEARPDVLKAYAEMGRNITEENWSSIAAEWSETDATGYALARARAEDECAPPMICCDPQPFSFAYLRQIAEQLNDLPAWNNYCAPSGCNRWNPLTDCKIINGKEVCAMPCMTWVSTIWFLAGIKKMDLQYVSSLNKTMYDGWTWYLPSNGGSSGYPWQTGDHFYDYIRTYYPELLECDEEEDPIRAALYSELGYDLRVGTVDDVQDQSKILEVNKRLRAGDILQFYGSFPGNCSKSYTDIDLDPEHSDFCFKHSVVVVETAVFHQGDCLQSALIASFGTPREYGFEWQFIARKYDEDYGDGHFDFNNVRVIPRPAISPLRQNYIVNPSFEGPNGPDVEEQPLRGWTARKKIGENQWEDIYVNTDDDFTGTPTTPANTQVFGDLNTASAHYGVFHLFHYSVQTDVTTSQVIKLEQGIYSIKSYVRCNKDKVNFIFVKKRDTPVADSEYKKLIPISTEWNLVSHTFSITYDYDGSVDADYKKWEVGIYSPELPNNECHIDDIQLY